VFVVADERSLRVGGKRGFSGAREPEEDCGVAVGTDVCRTMHRQHLTQRHQVIHDREDGLLDFARVAGAPDQDDLPRHVDEHERAAARSIALGIGDELGRIDDRELRRKIVRRALRRNEKISREQRVPRVLRDDADRKAVAWIGADVSVERVDFARRKIRGNAIEKCVEGGGIDRSIRLTPIDVRFTARFAHEKLVFGRTSGVLARFDNKLPVASQLAFSAPQRVLVELGRR